MHASTLVALCEAFGLPLLLGPSDPAADRKDTGSLIASPSAAFSETDTLPHRGLAKCGVDGWAKVVQDQPPLPRPVGLDDPDAFYVSARGQSMKPEGIESGWVCLVSPAAPVEPGDRVWIRDHEGRTSIKRLIEHTARGVRLRGWLPVKDGKQDSFDEDRFENGIDAIHAVVAVYAGLPGTDKVRFVPDPREERVQTAANIDEQAFGVINIHDVQVAAGAGRLADDGRIAGALAFPLPWLNRRGIRPAAASLINVAGTSMEPTLRDGAMVLINHDRTVIMPRRIYAFREGNDLYVKRLEQVADQLIVLSDNPDAQTRILTGVDLEQVAVIGEVVWVGETL